MRRRTKITLSIVVVVLLLLAGAVYLRKIAPPEVARLLPDSDGIIYLNLKPLRAATHFDEHPVPHDPDYQHFMDATGIHPERDLDQVAFALERMPNPNGPNGPVAFSEVFQGHFKGRKLAAYLQSIGATTQTYEGRTIYLIPSEGRTVRVVLLGSHYSDVPLLSPAWGVGKIGLPLSDATGGINIMGVSLPFSPDTTFVASLSWAGKTKLRVEEIAPTEKAAASSADAVQNLLHFVRTVTQAAPADSAHAKTQAELRQMLDGAEIKHHKDRVIFTATIPKSLLQQLLKTPVAMQ